MERNLRDMSVTTKSPGKPYWETDVISGEAKKTPAETEANETTQYETKSEIKGPFGGKPSHS